MKAILPFLLALVLLAPLPVAAAGEGDAILADVLRWKYPQSNAWSVAEGALERWDAAALGEPSPSADTLARWAQEYQNARNVAAAAREVKVTEREALTAKLDTNSDQAADIRALLKDILARLEQIEAARATRSEAAAND